MGDQQGWTLTGEVHLGPFPGPVSLPGVPPGLSTLPSVSGPHLWTQDRTAASPGLSLNSANGPRQRGREGVAVSRGMCP